MTVQEAIKGVTKIWKGFTSAYAEIKPDEVEAFDMAIKALEKQIPQKTQKDLQPTCNRLHK